MKKSFYLLILIFILQINLISGSYHCSNESNFIEGQGEIKLYDTKIVNEVKIGVISSRELILKNIMQADLILDAGKFSLSDVIKSTIVELKSGVYNISLKNITGGGGSISINGASKTIEEQETASINNLQVFIFNIKGAYLEEGSLEGIVGQKKVSLSSEKPEIIILNGTSYLLELNLASSDNILITVKKCNTGEIIEIKDKVNNTIVQNTSIENITLSNASIKNTTLINTSIKNLTLTNKSNLETNNKQTKTNLSFSKENIILIILSFIPLLILILYLWHLHNKKTHTL